jgi:Calcineurin-like phosphoesterase
LRKLIVPMMLGAGMLATANAAHADSSQEDRLTIAVFGDSPYGDNDADSKQFDSTDEFIATINSDPDVSLVLHVGDIHSGKQTCSQTYDQLIYDLWVTFHSPLVYTPGDNEWTDCHKSGEGSQPPLTNLGFVRTIFFSEPGNTIAVDKAVLTQAQNYDATNYPKDKEYVENVMWEQSKVVFVTVNLPGGSNNDEDTWTTPPGTRTQAQTDEILNRTGADLRWLDKAFTLALTDHARAVVIQLQADIWDLDSKLPPHIGAYRQFVDSIALHTTLFGGSVLLLNGDSHGYRSDNPLVKGAPCFAEKTGQQATVVACTNDAYDNQPYGYDVKNFHRLVVHGSNVATNPKMEWLKLAIKPGASAGKNSATSFGPFSWEREIQNLPPSP